MLKNYLQRVLKVMQVIDQVQVGSEGFGWRLLFPLFFFIRKEADVKAWGEVVLFDDTMTNKLLGDDLMELVGKRLLRFDLETGLLSLTKKGREAVVEIPGIDEERLKVVITAALSKPRDEFLRECHRQYLEDRYSGVKA